MSTVFGNELTIFGRCVCYISFQIHFSRRTQQSHTVFGNEANHFWKIDVLYIIQIHFSEESDGVYYI